MTLQTSGAISFTDLKNEYGGSSTNIKLGDYASKLENHGAGAHISYTHFWCLDFLHPFFKNYSI